MATTLLRVKSHSSYSESKAQIGVTEIDAESTTNGSYVTNFVHDDSAQALRFVIRQFLQINKILL